MRFALCDLIRFGHIGCLRPFWTIRNFKLHLFSCTKRFKSFTHNPCVVDKNIVSIGLFDKPISLLCIKPLHKPFCQDPLPPLLKWSFQRNLISLIHEDVKILICPQGLPALVGRGFTPLDRTFLE